ncbi:MAG: hypothetical protein GY807_00570 [Gammaproteobacteria bacterium]|nr:hypothetical protein [Gammaproteobacteria bacterium]
MTRSSKVLLIIGIVIAIIGMAISAGAKFPQVGLKVFVIGFGLFVAGILHSHLVGWWRDSGARKHLSLSIALAGFGFIVLVQTVAVFRAIPDGIVSGVTVLGSIFMLVGIGLHTTSLK